MVFPLAIHSCLGNPTQGDFNDSLQAQDKLPTSTRNLENETIDRFCSTIEGNSLPVLPFPIKIR